MSAIRRVFFLGELSTLAPKSSEAASPLFRLEGLVEGRGRWVRERQVGGEFGDCELVADASDEFCIVLEHDWPEHLEVAAIAELDWELTIGIVESFARHGPLGTFGCRIRTQAVLYNPATTPMAMRLASSLAIADMLKKATWTLTMPTSPKVA